MNAVVRKALSLGIKARTIWLAFLSGIFVGWMLCAAWMLVIRFAPEVAIGMIAKVGAL